MCYFNCYQNMFVFPLGTEISNQSVIYNFFHAFAL